MEAIVDYRGDATVTRRSTGESIVGYIFDCAYRDDRVRAAVRLLPEDGSRRVTVPLHDVAAIELTGRDTAEGKSFETWVKKYVEKKLAGEPANIDP